MAELHALLHEVSTFIRDDISYFWYHNNVLLAHGNIIKFYDIMFVLVDCDSARLNEISF